MTQMFAVFISTLVHTQKGDDTFKVGCVYLRWENASKRRNRMRLYAFAHLFSHCSVFIYSTYLIFSPTVTVC